MGEKLLAQRVLALLRDTVGRQSKEGLATLDWATDQRDWLWPGHGWAEDAAPGLFGRISGDTLDWDSLPGLVAAIGTDEPEPVLFAGVAAAADLLGLGDFDRALLATVAAFERLPRLSALRQRLANVEADVTMMIGRLAGAEPGEEAARVRRSEALALGLLWLGNAGYGGAELQLQWRFTHVLDDGLVDESRLVAALAGIRQTATLERRDFAEHEESFDLLVRLLRGALAARTRGVSLLIHGPPGTGKTELARTLAAEAGASLFAVGEADADGEEPSRSERLHALKRAQRLLARRGGSVLLFDEMEDLFAEAGWSAGGGRRSGSKIFVNRLLEDGAVPVIWTSNALGEIDPAHLRRMSFVLRMDHPSPRVRTQ